MKDSLLTQLCHGQELSFYKQVKMIVYLSVPSILAQISSILMEYIDASMVGHLGSLEAASIGLIASSTWLFFGLSMATSVGFSVQVALSVGAGDFKKARNLVSQCIRCTLLFSIIVALLGAGISPFLPELLGGTPEICENASWYFLIFVLFFPILQMNGIATAFLQSSGNMKLPSILHIFMCVLDVVFNLFLIFPETSFEIFGSTITLTGFGLGVIGAALGTGLAELIVGSLMLYFLVFRSQHLKKHSDEHCEFRRHDLLKAVRLASPVGLEQILMSSAYIAFTVIVAPLGNTDIAANSFSVTAESLCYMPGYGISVAATTIIGQIVGAGRIAIAKKLAWICTSLGMLVMTGTGVLLYIFAPFVIGLFTNDPEIRELGTSILRIEAFAEPLFAAAIVTNGVFRGAGDTLIPSFFNFLSIWLIRLPLAWYLAGIYGLQGVWIAMSCELCCRGLMFISRLSGKSWLSKASLHKEESVNN